MGTRCRHFRRGSWIAVVALASGLTLAGDCLAQEERPPEEAPTEEAPPAEAPEGAPPAAAGEETGAVTGEGSGQGDEGEKGEEDEKDEEPEDRPGTLRLSTDADCRLEIDGRPEGELKADEPRRVRVPLGPVKVRAIALETPLAEWETTVEVTAEGVSRVRVRMVSSIAAVRRRERQSESYRDAKRGLMWRRSDNAADITWQGAAAYCEELRHGGFDNWRLPTIDELDTLKAIWSLQAFKTIGGVVLTSCCAWSSTEAGPGQAWNYNFRYRRGFTGNVAFRLGMRALCVRPLDAAELEELSKKAIKARRKARKEREEKKREQEEGPVEPDGRPQDPPGADPPAE